MTLDVDEHGRARVCLFAFDVEDLRITGVPLVRSSYAELLWRIAVRAGGEPAWWVIACDLGPALPRMLAARLVRYPVRAQHVVLAREQLSATGAAGGLAISLGAATGATRAVESRPLLVGDRAQWDVPWGDGGDASEIAVTIASDTLSVPTLGTAIAWSRVAWLRTGREHRCGVAHSTKRIALSS